jgi:hypothetical protein
MSKSFTPLAPMNRFVLALTIILGTPTALTAQVVQTPEGTVEFIGLNRWSVLMIQDSMAVHAPGKPLGQCAAVLKQLGFVSASAMQREGPDGQRRTVVSVVEPQHADRIQLRRVAGDSLPNSAAWQPGIDIYSGHNHAFQSAIQWRGLWLQQDTAIVGQILQLAGDRATQVQDFWEFLDNHRGLTDLEKALHTIATDRNRTNAAVAAAILTNFPDEPQAWWALIDAHRDSREHVAATASQAMRGLLMAGPREIDWKPAAVTVRALLDGTNVFVLESVLSALASTKITPELAPVLLRDGGADLVLARLRATDERTRKTAHAFLVQISGTDHGEDAAAWAAWIESLPPE